MPLPFEPACLPLLLGSLPYHSAAQALDLSRTYAGALLAWPQLPQRSFREHSLVQSAVGFPGLVIDEAQARVYVDRRKAEHELDQLALAYLENNYSFAALAPEHAVGLAEVLAREHELKDVLALKGQVLGPLSLATQLTDERQRPLIYDDVLFAAVVQHVRLRATWQEARLGEISGATIICLDEPFLEVVGQAFLTIDWEDIRARLDEVFSGLIGGKGLFAGGAMNWSQALQTSAELLIGDVYEHADGLRAAGTQLAAFLERDGIIGFGLIPADADALRGTSADQLTSHLIELLDSLATAIPPDRVLRQAVISSTDGLGRLDSNSAERALQLIQQVSTMLRQ